MSSLMFVSLMLMSNPTIALIQQKCWPLKNERRPVQVPTQYHDFTPFVCSTDGLLDCEAKVFLCHITTKLAANWQQSYSTTCDYTQAQLDVAIVQATHHYVTPIFQPLNEHPNGRMGPVFALGSGTKKKAHITALPTIASSFWTTQNWPYTNIHQEQKLLSLWKEHVSFQFRWDGMTHVTFGSTRSP